LRRYINKTINEEGLNCIEKIYTEKDFKSVSGRQAKDMINSLLPEQRKSPLKENPEEILDIYRR
jgi:hypothetical protein